MFDPSRPFRSCLMFEGKAARGLSLRGAPEKCSIRVDSSLTHKHQTRLESFSRVFASGWPFLPSLMYTCKAMGLPLTGGHVKGSNRVVSSLTRKH